MSLFLWTKLINQYSTFFITSEKECGRHMNLIKTIKKYLATKKLAERSFLELYQAYIEQEEILKEALKKYDK